MKSIDLNVDLGEGGGHDQALMAYASSVNIACGGHAGDAKSIRHSIALAQQAKVAIGAHPGYEDRENFGRRPMHLSAGEIRDMILRQLERILYICPKLHHIKPHGALYNQADQDETMAEALVAAIAEVQPDALIYCPPGGALVRAASHHNMASCAEGFIDRRYQNDGSLCPRSAPNAVIETRNEAVAQALQFVSNGTATTIDQAVIPLDVKTLCVHGDGKNALALLHVIRSIFEGENIKIAAP